MDCCMAWMHSLFVASVSIPALFVIRQNVHQHGSRLLCGVKRVLKAEIDPPLHPPWAYAAFSHEEEEELLLVSTNQAHKPDDLLHDKLGRDICMLIRSFVPTQDAVRTRRLSRTWNSMAWLPGEWKHRSVSDFSAWKDRFYMQSVMQLHLNRSETLSRVHQGFLSSSMEYELNAFLIHCENMYIQWLPLAKAASNRSDRMMYRELLHIERYCKSIARGVMARYVIDTITVRLFCNEKQTWLGLSTELGAIILAYNFIQPYASQWYLQAGGIILCIIGWELLHRYTSMTKSLRAYIMVLTIKLLLASVPLGHIVDFAVAVHALYPLALSIFSDSRHARLLLYGVILTALSIYKEAVWTFLCANNLLFLQILVLSIVTAVCIDVARDVDLMTSTFDAHIEQYEENYMRYSPFVGHTELSSAPGEGHVLSLYAIIIFIALYFVGIPSGCISTIMLVCIYCLHLTPCLISLDFFPIGYDTTTEGVCLVSWWKRVRAHTTLYESLSYLAMCIYLFLSFFNHIQDDHTWVRLIVAGGHLPAWIRWCRGKIR